MRFTIRILFLLGLTLACLNGSCLAQAIANNNNKDHLDYLCEKNTEFLIGTGIYDITGPAAEEGMMGYGQINQKTAGIYQRLWARAFVIASPCNNKRVVLVNTDLGMVFQGVKQRVIRKLKTLYGDTYLDDNVLISATHTHSGPGGFSTDLFYNITTKGFDRKHFDAIVNGIVEAIIHAHTHLTTGRIKIAKANLDGISSNRSPQAYLLNPDSERAKYSGDVDKEMTLLRFETNEGIPIGMINWYPVHGVSLSNQNHLISSDNKGYAEYRFEKDYQQIQDTFVAAFMQANAGDVSPNTYGTSGSNGIAGLKKIIAAGFPQYETAKALFSEANESLVGGVDYIHQFYKMDEIKVDEKYSGEKNTTTCPAGIGISMFAGTQDGEGVGQQGTTCATLKHLGLICKKLMTPCQGIKPVLLSTGKMKPYPWTPNILPIQIIKIGNLIIPAAPFELTTMTGRRIKEIVSTHYPDPNYHIVISALANAYAGYVATNQEYPLQRYEGASTHFGPWTSQALVQLFDDLSVSLKHNKTLANTLIPPDLYDKLRNYQPGVIYDKAPRGRKFGDIYKKPKYWYKPGDKVEVIFWGAHPKNHYRTQKTFLAVEKWDKNCFKPIKNDNDWDTEFYWERKGASHSLITIVWRIPKDQEPGYYRIVYYGDAKKFGTKEIIPFKGETSSFNVVK